jgi:hypothetical protein
MKQTQSYRVKMTGTAAAELILSGVYVRRVSVIPHDPNLYITVKHLYDCESSVLKNVWTGEEKIELWDRIEFA